MRWAEGQPHGAQGLTPDLAGGPARRCVGPGQGEHRSSGLLQHRVEHTEVLTAGQLVAHDLGGRGLEPGAGKGGGKYLQRVALGAAASTLCFDHDAGDVGLASPGEAHIGQLGGEAFISQHHGVVHR